MPSTEEILTAARALGDQIAEHTIAKKLTAALTALEKDIEAQRALTDYQRLAQGLMEKQSQGRPIEVEDKRKLEKLQNAVARNLTLQSFQMAQMDYLDLMQQVDQAISGDLGAEMGGPPAAAETPLGNPNVAGIIHPG